MLTDINQIDKFLELVKMAKKFQKFGGMKMLDFTDNDHTKDYYNIVDLLDNQTDQNFNKLLLAETKKIVIGFKL